MTFNWSKWPFVIGVLYSGLITVLDIYLKLNISLPWQPISIVGIAVAFYLGFKNNSSYDRTWEARKIWGSIVNNSRAFGAAVVAFVKGTDQDAVRKELIYRHIAWLTVLRYQLRLSREWEHVSNRLNGLYAPTVCEDYFDKMDHELLPFLPLETIDRYRRQTNIATQILRDQSVRLQELRDSGYFEDFRHMEFHQLIVSLYADQGRSERIKNFPFPRQYASAAMWLTVVFSAVFPLGMVDIFRPLGDWMLLICPVVSGLVIWTFALMEMIGDYSENPFEGTYNDVPITSIARGIEIDLREMIGDSDIPEPVKAENGFLM